LSLRSDEEYDRRISDYEKMHNDFVDAVGLQIILKQAEEKEKLLHNTIKQEAIDRMKSVN
jgi:hypothetical protein